MRASTAHGAAQESNLQVQAAYEDIERRAAPCGEGDVDTLSADPLGGPVLQRATELLSQLVALTEPQ